MFVFGIGIIVLCQNRSSHKLCGHVSKFGTCLFNLLDSHSNSMSNEFWVKRNRICPMMFATYQPFPMDSYERLSTYQPQYQAFSNVKIWVIYHIYYISPLKRDVPNISPGRFSGARPSSSLHHIDRCTLRIPCESRLHSCPGSYLSVPMAFRKLSKWRKMHKNSGWCFALLFCMVSLQSASFWQRGCRWW